MMKHGALAALILLAAPPGMAFAQGFNMSDPPGYPPPPSAAPARPNYGGGFIEYLLTGGTSSQDQAPTQYRYRASSYGQRYAYAVPTSAPRMPVRAAMDPRFLPQEVAYSGSHRPGTIVVDTGERYLYLVEADGRAMRYGVGVGREGFEWRGTKTIERKAEWPDWRPPAQMLKRRQDLPTYMAGGPDNPLGARAMYLGGTLYRIHGSNEPWTIGQAVSSGCIRMRNEDVIDLYDRVKVGATVVVM
jgi:lipoprotein-anchoring transpeptidase ErfK/SrfK